MSSVRAKTAIGDLLNRWSPLQRLLERLGSTGQPIFAFHRVLPDAAPSYDPEMVTTSEVFARFLDWVVDAYRVVDLDELVSRKESEHSAKDRVCALTFDDGWSDNFTHAFPLLRARQLTAKVFLAVRFIGTGRRFWQERLWRALQAFATPGELHEAMARVVHHLPWCQELADTTSAYASIRRLLLTRASEEAEDFVDRLCDAAGWVDQSDSPAFLSWQEVETMRDAGITFASHTLNHALLSRADPATAWRELDASRRKLAERLGSAPQGIAYPWGAVGPYTRNQAKAAGYRYGLTTEGRLAGRASDPFLLPRVLVSDSAICGLSRRFHAGTSTLLLARAGLRLPGGAGKALGAAKHRAQRTRVGFVIDSIDSFQDGGTEQQLAKLVDGMNRLYFEPELFLLRPSRHLTPADFPCPVHVVVERQEIRWYQLDVLARLTRLLRSRRPDVVQTFFRDGTYYGALAAKFAGVPKVVVSVRNAGYWKRPKDRLPLSAVRVLVDSWQCNSRWLARALESEQRVARDRVEILPNSVDLARFVPATPTERERVRSHLGLPAHAPVLISVANLRPVKDLSTLIGAAGRLQEKLPDAHYLLVGDGPLRPALKAQAVAAGLESRIRFLGPIADVQTYAAAADVGLLTSRSEASSNAVLEYMAMGLPAVVSDIPGNRDLLDETFFTPGDAADLARKIAAVWDNPEARRRMGAENRRRANGYGAEAFVQRAESHYSRLAASA